VWFYRDECPTGNGFVDDVWFYRDECPTGNGFPQGNNIGRKNNE
jgi:hypothetical protein